MSNQSDTKRRLVASFMKFLSEEMKGDELSSEAKDSIEVTLQCLEEAYKINPVDGTLPSSVPLLEIFAANCNQPSKIVKKEISAEEKIKANELKNQGNEFMESGQFANAVDAYTKAIEIDKTNPIYYCNRAAAHNKLNNYQASLNDSELAIQIDPTYSKAYCRMGLAYINLNDPLRARDAYKKAYELNPSDNNKSNLELAEEKLLETTNASSAGGFGGLENFLKNPQIMNMASKIMTDPNMQNIFSQIMTSAMEGKKPEDEAQSGSEETNQSGPNQSQPFGGFDFNTILQQFAQQVKDQNPELIEKLKKFTDPNDKNPPPPPPASS
ncbi:Small glutamine-rich tetratricopeptide repeat-containing protein beta [Sarcoptes scabiei]|nr:Small glutamine-rich tetratricopeptide repeat-containing protein beta [Sarcoptes scabiei]